MLELDRVSKRYGRKLVLDRVDHGFGTGLTLLTGPSGAGKSTLLRLIATAERPSGGRISWDGEELPRATKGLRAALGYAPQAVDLPEDLTAREFALHIAALKGLAAGPADRQFLSLAEAVGLHADANGRIATFSGGMRRRLIFIQALLGEPQLIALDEPTAELDADSAGRVTDLICYAARTAIVVMTTHALDTVAARASVMLRVADGRVGPA